MGMRPCSVNGIEFDALISESRSLTAEAPEYAVESGFSVSDNISIKPMVVEITANLTNTPVTWLDSHGTGRVETVVAQLENLYFSRQLVTVVTSTDTYRNMAITSPPSPMATLTCLSNNLMPHPPFIQVSPRYKNEICFSIHKVIPSDML